MPHPNCIKFVVGVRFAKSFEKLPRSVDLNAIFHRNAAALKLPRSQYIQFTVSFYPRLIDR